MHYGWRCEGLRGVLALTDVMRQHAWSQVVRPRRDNLSGMQPSFRHRSFKAQTAADRVRTFCVRGSIMYTSTESS
jgi:hypothetical protein